MYLKKLSLTGFKSFANGTDLEFGPGITGVVGPNGSGKSNVVDGIMWAMGERSHKALRGHASTDVIFSGSGSRKPLGMAEVTLFFDNEDNQLPLEFKEVQVTRRLFRDGDSEYAINKTNCRLRDVHDLFLDTGIGPESFSIISQGEIDAILSAKPEDRRGLIEGAAGVQKYHARRDETRRKLMRVEADLTRISDITAELETQIEPLAMQAEIAREYDNYVARLRTLQLAVLARDYDARIKRMETLRASQTENSQAVNEGGAAIERLEKVETELEATLRRLEGANDVLQADLTDVVSRLKATEGTIAVSHERRRALTEQQEFQAKEIGLLRARIEALREQAASDKRELDAARQSSGELSGAAAQAEAKLGEATARLSEATRELQGLQAQVIDLMRASQSRREAAASGRAEARAQENRLGDLSRLETELQSEAAEVEGAQKRAAQQLESLIAGRSSTLVETEAKKEAWQQSQTTRASAADAMNETRRNQSALTSRLGALRELEENLEGVQGGARAVLAAVKRGQLPDNYTLFADAVRAPQKLEQAMEVALGAGVHNLICPADADAKKAIDWLKENRAGRATFLPLPNLRPSKTNERTQAILREAGVLGLASELVEYSASHRAAVEYLLGRVVIVETLEIAVALAKKCDFGVRLVTLQGELVLPAGAITGGQGKGKSSGLLARKRELDEAEARLQSLQDELQKYDKDLQNATEAVEAAHESWRAGVDAANDLSSQIARQERENEHLLGEARRVAKNREAVLSQQKAAQSTLGDKAGALQTMEREAGELDEQARLLDERVVAAQKIVAQRQSEREIVTESVAEVRAEYSATRERLNGMQRAIADMERQASEFETQIRSKQASIASAEGEDKKLIEAESELVSALAQLQSRRAELEAAGIRTRAERGEALTQLGTIESTLRTRRTGLHEAEDELHRIEIRIASTETEIADYERRFDEEFQLPLEEALTFRDEIEQKNLAQDEIQILRERIGGLGEVNTGAISQYEQVKERLEFLTGQRVDLDESKGKLEEIIAEIDERTRERFMDTFHKVQSNFDELFKRIFDGCLLYTSPSPRDS